MGKGVLAWHFVREDRRLRDGNTVKPGYVYSVDPHEIELCQWGLHASVKPLDALEYAPGLIVCRVECRGRVVHDEDKLVCSEREVLWMADATETIQGFARWCALRVIDKWDAPDLVRRYLNTGDESIRGAAWAAAWAAACTVKSKNGALAANAATWAARSATRRSVKSAAGFAAACAAELAAARVAALAAQNKKLTEMLEQLRT